VPASSDAAATGGAPATAATVVRLPEGVDLHARPAADFVRCALTFDASISVSAGDREADAKSLLAVLALGAKGGSGLRLHADGEDAPAALDAMARCVASLS
jgi:phosphotransferase system HPr (HPr) family protein